MIRYNLAVLFVFLIFVAGVEAPSWGAMTSSGYSIPTSVISGGGSRMSSSSYELAGILGQSSPLGGAAGPNFELKTGFWENVSSVMMRKLGLTSGILLLLLGE